MLYLAYGSNLNVEQMKWRCPDATPVKGLAIDKYKLVFKYFADIEKDDDSILYAGLWDITPKCEESLDHYEGVDNQLYFKRYFRYKGDPVLYYKMNNYKIEKPSRSYVQTIAKGYKDFSLPERFLYESVGKAIQFEEEFKYFEPEEETFK
jgi:hypothetical protein